MNKLRALASHLHPNSLFGRLVLMWVLVMWTAHLVNFAIGYYAGHVPASSMPRSYWPAIVVMTQLLAAVLVTWIAVRHATRPLTRLAKAAESIGSTLRFEPIPETGPTEVAAAATAFNAMQRRIAAHLEERVRILAAISHDLQTPITRMRLRADLADNIALRDKFHDDLDAMQALVEEGIAYARSAHSNAEPECRIDLDAFLDSIAGDYVDTGKLIGRSGKLGEPLTTRPNALRRIVTNLLDNACKFGGNVELAVERSAGREIMIAVLDRGPGLPESELEAVMQPFYRLESSRNRSTGGTGLGLAIAQQLSMALGGKLALANRDGGGLAARLTLPL